MSDSSTNSVIPAGKYQPPFPWFGGKSRVADVVWSALGDVENYVEPFFGSGAVLFLRPGGPGKIETVNDADGFVANFWRAIQRDSDAVADHADWPVNEADLHARHLWLVGQRERITDRLCGDPDFYDAKVAGWWVWGQCCWIGGGWCSGRGGWTVNENGEMVRGDGAGRVERKTPHLGPARGVHRRMPHLGSTDRRAWLREYLGWFAARLARVRVCCGDWSRVCGYSVTFLHGLTGVFLDPPYANTAGRTDNCYSVDSLQVAHDVREWAIEQGKNPLMRIVLAGYEGEHQMPSDWRVYKWKAQGGMSNFGNGQGKINRHRERLWFSPACLDPHRTDTSLFAVDQDQ
jgi:site-specific DNA-adenine methylase